jgi:hypothetical protein
MAHLPSTIIEASVNVFGSMKMVKRKDSEVKSEVVK